LEELLQGKPGDKRRHYWNAGVAGGNHSPAARYVALKRARDLEIEGNNISFALRIADTISDRYAVSRQETRAETLELAARSGKQPQHVADQALRLAAEAQAQEDYDTAVRLAKVASSAAAQARQPAAVEAASRLESEVAAAKADLPAARNALETLARNPADPEANEKLGRFRCVRQDAWDEGLPLLAKGGDGVLQALARREAAGPQGPEARKDLGDGWLDAAEKEQGPARKAFRRRAYHWYRRALPGLTAGQADVRKRMDALAAEMPDLLDPWRDLDISDATRQGDYLHLEPLKCIFTRRWYRGGVDITVEARTPKNNIRLTAGQGGRVIFNWEGTGGGMILSRPDNPATDGRGLNAGRDVQRNRRDLETNRWYRLRWLLTAAGSKVWVDDELVMSAEETYDLSAPRPVGVCAFPTSPIDVKSVVVQPVQGSDSPSQ
jgi:hypothetical protein